MLNISKEPLQNDIDLTKFKSGKNIFNKDYYKSLNKFLIVFAIVGLIVLFLPWTQNITGSGLVTTLTPDQRPQTIQSQIPGRIEKWYVLEGDFVQKGDTILKTSEVKTEYFDDQLIEKTSQQINAKSSAVNAYQTKVNFLSNQIESLENERELKLEMARNKLLQSKLKVKSDSIAFEAAKTNIRIAKTQFNRDFTLEQEGIKAKKDVEEKRLKLQKAEAEIIEKENKLLASKNQVLNAQYEISRVKASFGDKISKAQSEQETARSNQYDAEAQVSKLQITNSNYIVRNNLRYVLAPQDGYINRILRGGIGETFKEGEELVTIMPANVKLAVETFIRPIDLPLIHIGENVRVQFDGWPAIVFSGWPNVSYGTYGAKVVAIERSTRQNGMYRILLAPDKEDHEWPVEIRPGSGAKTIALLEDVPIWFELWRQLNSFPPNYYQPEGDSKSGKDKKNK